MLAVNVDREHRRNITHRELRERFGDSKIKLGFAEDNAIMQLNLGDIYIVTEEIDVTPETDLDDHVAWRVEFSNGTSIYLLRQDGRFTTCEVSGFEDYLQQTRRYKNAF